MSVFNQALMAIGCRFPIVDKLSGAAVKLSEVTFSYGLPPQPPVFSDVTISAQSDSRIAVVGIYSKSLKQ